MTTGTETLSAQTAAPPPSVNDLVEQGRRQRLLFDVAGYEAAVPLLREAIEVDPTCALAYAELSQTYSYWGFRREICGLECQSLYDMAYDYAEIALRLAAHSDAAHRAMAVALRRGEKADPQRRLQEARIAADLDPVDPENLCERWRAEGYDPEDAALSRLRELSPGLISVHIDLGAVFCELGRFDEALGELRRALELNPRNLQAYYDVAMVLDRQGRREKAVEVLRQARALNQEDALLLQGLASLGEGL